MNVLEERQPYLGHVRRERMVKQCREWTATDGHFPLDHGTDFDTMPNRQLLDYHDHYKWALDENNFKSFNLSNKKGG